MKLIYKILVAVGLLAAALPASAQFDLFYANKHIIATLPEKITATDSNSVIDIHGYEGIAVVDLICLTNQGNATVTCQLYGSPDRTNWTAITYALAVSNNVVYTNIYYGTGTPLATNTFNRTGTLTTPTAATAGFATAYLAPAALTNTGAIAMTTGFVTVGFNAQDAGRYLQIDWIVTGGSSPTNTVAAKFTGRKQQE